MNKVIFYFGLFFLGLGQLNAQVIFSEDFGVPTANTLITAYSSGTAPATFQNVATCNFSGNGEVRNTQNSTGYTNVSGDGNVYLVGSTQSDFQVSNINTSGYSSTTLSLSFGIYKNTNSANGSDLIVEVSSNGVDYTALNFTPLSTGSGSQKWYLRTATGAIPSVGNLYIRFRNTAISGANYRIDDVVLSSNTPPSNDEPCFATALPLPTSTCTYSNSSTQFATISTGISSPSCVSSVQNDVWFSVVVPANGVVSIKTQAGTMTDGVMTVYRGTCSALVEIACNDNSTGMPLVTISGQTPGATLWIRVWGWSSSDAGSFGICATSPTLPSNDEPCNATALPAVTTTCSYLNSTTENATVSSSASSSNLCSTTQRADVWFSVIVPSSGTVVIKTQAGTLTDGVMSVYRGACGSLTELSCNDNGSNMPQITLTGQTSGTTLWIRVWGWSNSDVGTFGICATTPPSPPSNDLCTASTSISNGACVNGTTLNANDNVNGTAGCQSGTGDHPDVWYSFVSTGTQAQISVTTSAPFSDDIELVLYSGTCGSLTVINNKCGPSPLTATFSGLTSGVTYYYLVSNTSSGTAGPFQTCASTSTPLPVPGQDCSTAAILCNGNSFSQSTSDAGFGSSNEVTQSNSCFGPELDGSFLGERQSKWFKFTVGKAGRLRFNINPINANNDYDWALWDVTAGCSLTGTNLKSCNWDGYLTGVNGSTGMATNSCKSSETGATNLAAWENAINVTAGNTYVLLIDNYSASNSGFTLKFGGTGSSTCTSGNATIGPTSAFTTSNSCAYVTFTKTDATTNSTYLWNFGDGSTSTILNPSHLYTSNGTYTVTLTVTDALNCSSVSSNSIIINNYPSINITTTSKEICASSTVQTVSFPYTVSTGSPTTYSITWSIPSPLTSVSNALLSGGNINYSIPANTPTGIYTGTITVKNACSLTSVTIPISVKINVTPSITLSSTAPAVCFSQDVQLSTLTYSNLTGSPTTYSITWNALPANTFTQISNAALTSSPIEIRVPANTNPGTYTGVFTVSNSNCSSPVNNFTLEVKPSPSALISVANSSGTLTAPYTVCHGEGLTLSNVARTDIVYYNRDQTSLPDNGVPITGTYTTLLSLQAAFYKGTKIPILFPTGFNPTINSTTLPIVNIKINHLRPKDLRIYLVHTSPSMSDVVIPLCLNRNLSITGSNFDSTIFSMSATNLIINASAPFAGTYKPEGDFNTLVGRPIAGDWYIRVGDNASGGGLNNYLSFWSIKFGENAADTYLWSTGESTNSIIVNPTTTSVYDLTVSNSIGCTAESSVLINVNVADAGLISGDNNVCINNSETLTSTVSGGTWSTEDASVATINASTGVIVPIAAGSVNMVYTVPGVGSCPGAQVSFPVQVRPQPNATIINNSGTNQLTCTQTSISLTANGGSQYSWSNGIQTQNVNITSADLYTVTVTDNYGCSNTADINITASSSLPNASINSLTGETELNCATTSITLQASGGVGYLWNNGSTSTSINVTTPGIYSVRVSGSNGCFTTAQIEITSDLTPPDAVINNLTDATELNCNRNEINISASGGNVYSWNMGLGNNANQTITSPGTYIVYVTSSNGCSSSAQIEITSDLTPPDIQINSVNGQTELNCTNTQINLVAAGALSFSWNMGLGSNSGVTITSPGTYIVTGTGSNGCTANSSIEITENTQVPIVSINNNSNTTVLTCTQTVINLTAVGGTTFLWSNGLGFAAQASITNPGNYTVAVTGDNGCTSNASITISQNLTLPTADIVNNSSSSVLTCSLTLISLTATGGSSYSWSNGLGNNANATITQPGTYTVTVTGSNGCNTTAQFSVSSDVVAPSPFITNNGSSNELTCIQSSISLFASGGNSYSWNNGLGNNANVTITQPGTYILTAFASNGCSASSQIVITQNTTLPVVGITNNSGTTALTCTQPAISLTATSNGSYSWNNGLGSNATVSIGSAGTYIVTATGTNGCTNTAQVIITASAGIPTPSINNITGSTELNCVRSSISVAATGGSSYSWSNGLGNNANATITQPGTYTVTVTGANGCSATSQITITRDITAPNATIVNNSSETELTCIQSSISLSASGGNSYSWNNGLGNNANVTITQPGTYILTAFASNGCTATSQIVITQNTTLPVAGITNNSGTTILTCSQSTISLTATGSGSYTWNNGLGNNATVSIGSAGTYIVTVTGTNGCTSDAQIVVTASSGIPTASITNVSGGTELNCIRNSINVTASGGGTYSWSNGLGNNANATITQPGTYTVTVTSSNGCSATSQITITRDITAPNATLVNNSNATELTCNQTSINLIANGGGVYSWNNALGNNSNVTVTNPGNYTVTVTGTNGCTSTASITITQNITAPTAGITNNSGTAVITCSQPSISLTATGGATYSWNNGLGNNATVSIGSAGTYIVTATSTNGCTSSAQVILTASSTIPTAVINNLTGTTELNCTNNTINLTATGGSSYSWSNGLGNSANAIITQPGIYTVTVTASNGCSATSNIQITENFFVPIASITNNSGTTVLTCSQPSVNLIATGGATYSWNNGLGNVAAVTLGSAGNYIVTVTGTNGCTSSEQIDITASADLPVVSVTNLTGQTVLDCNTPQINLIAQGGNSYSWSNGLGNNPSVNILSPGTYTVTVSSSNGCSASSQVNITQDIALPTANIVNNTNATVINCNHPVISLSATGGISYGWSQGLGNNTDVTITAPGTYSVSVEGANGCTADAQILITLGQTSAISSSFSAVSCGNYVLPWGEIASSTGDYVHTYTTSQGCDSVVTATITVSPGGVSSSFTASSCSSYSLPWGDVVSATGTYTHTYTTTQGCDSIVTANITIDNPTQPLFNPVNICVGSNYQLPTVSENGITGSWSPAFDNTTSAIYQFVPDAGQCAAGTSLNVVVNPNDAEPLFTPVERICVGTNFVLPAVSNNGISGNWTPAVNNTTTTTYTFTPTTGQCPVNAEMLVVVNPLPQGNFSASQSSICEGDSVQLNASNAAGYQWYFNGNPLPGAVGGNYFATQEGSYTVEYVSDSGCRAMATQVATLSLTRKPEVIFAAQSTCPLKPITFSSESDVTSSLPVTYTWNFGNGQISNQQQDITTYAVGGTYNVTLTVTPDACPQLADSVTRSVLIYEPRVGIRYNPVDAVIHEPVTLSARSFGRSYLWQPSTGLSSDVIRNPVLDPTREVTFTVKIGDLNGCETVDTQFVRIHRNVDIQVPQVFTPNGDGNNDLLYPFNIGIKSLKYFRVYNRWGNLLFESNDWNASRGWNGVYRGKPQPSETYIWVAEGIDADGKPIKRGGNVMLVR